MFLLHKCYVKQWHINIVFKICHSLQFVQVMCIKYMQLQNDILRRLQDIYGFYERQFRCFSTYVHALYTHSKGFDFFLLKKRKNVTAFKEFKSGVSEFFISFVKLSNSQIQLLYITCYFGQIRAENELCLITNCGLF